MQITFPVFATTDLEKDPTQNIRSFSSSTDIKIRAGDTALWSWPAVQGKRGFEISISHDTRVQNIFIGFKPLGSKLADPKDPIGQMFYRLNGQMFYNWDSYLGAFTRKGPILFTYDSQTGVAQIKCGYSSAKFNYPPDTCLCPFIFYKDTDADIELTINLTCDTVMALPPDVVGWLD